MFLQFIEIKNTLRDCTFGGYTTALTLQKIHSLLTFFSGLALQQEFVKYYGVPPYCLPPESSQTVPQTSPSSSPLSSGGSFYSSRNVPASIRTYHIRSLQFYVVFNALQFRCAATMCLSNLILPSLSYSIQLKLEMLCCISI